MYGYESRTIKKAECWRIDAFDLWCWRRLLTVPWTSKRSNQSTLKEINPEYSLEGLMLKLKLQYFGHLIWRVDSLKKTLMLGKIEAGEQGDKRGWDGWMAPLTQWTWVWASHRERKVWKWTVKRWLKAQHSENEDHGIRSQHSMGNRWGNSGNSVRLHFWGLQNHCRWWLHPWN